MSRLSPSRPDIPRWVPSLALAVPLLLYLALALLMPRIVTPMDDLDWLRRGAFFSIGGINDSWRPPAYYWFVGTAMWVFKYKFLALRLLQALTVFASVLAFYGLSRQFLDRRWSTGAALMVAFWPEQLPNVLFFVTEPLSMILLFLGLTALVRGFREAESRRQLPLFAAAGILLGAAALVREVYFFTALFLPAALLPLPRPARARLLLAGAFVLGLLLPVGAFAFRNSIRWQSRDLISNNAPYNLWKSWDPTTTFQEKNAEFFSWEEKDRAPRCWARTRDALLRNPGHVAARIVANLGLTVLPDNSIAFPWYYGVFHRGKTAAVALLLGLTGVLTIVTVGLALAAAWRHWKTPEIAVLVMVTLFSTTITSLAAGMGRYRYPVVPLIVLLAALALREHRTATSPSRRRIVMTQGISAAVFALSALVAGREFYATLLVDRETGVAASRGLMETEFRKYSRDAAGYYERRAAGYEQTLREMGITPTP